jgi:PAS domain S-box-containing protein
MPVNPKNNREAEQEGHSSHPGSLLERAYSDTSDTMRESEEKYRRVFDLANDGILLHTLTPEGIPGQFMDVNRMACRMLGYRREELLALGPTDIVPVELHPQLSDLVRRASSHDSFLFETRLMRKDGTTFPAESNSHLINYDGKTVWISVIRDISERKGAENALRESEAHYKHLVENISDVIFTLDPQGTITYISPVISKIYGYSPDEVIGTYFGRFVHPDDLSLITDAFNRRDEGACSEITFRILTKDGTGRYVRVTETPQIVDGTTVGFNYIMTDITDRKYAEEALIESEEFNRGLVENLPDFIVIYDINGVIRYANTAALECIGLPASQVIGTYAPTFIIGSNYGDIEKKMKQRLSGGTLPPYEINIRVAGNRTITAILRGSPITYRKEPCVLLVMTDITDRKRSEEALTESENALRQANKKLNLLSGITRHDILNQVAILEGYLDLAGEEVKAPELQEYMGHLDQAVKTIQRQIEFTREYQEIGVNAAAWQNVRETVLTAGRTFDRDDVALTITCSEVEIFADPLLEKVFYNLFDNAFRYAPPFSKITVSCDETGEGLSVVFADDGVGISAEDRKHLFERGFGKHTGLGLFLTREILAITGTTITENGVEGKGARFEIIVPKGAYRTSEKA